MAARTILVPGIGPVQFHKRKGARNVRLRIDASGKVTVTLPYIVPYAFAVKFAARHATWVATEQSQRSVFLTNGMMIGKQHRLRLLESDAAVRPKTRVTATDIIVRYAGDIEAPDVQAAAHRAAIRALRQEAELYLPDRLATIARTEGYNYRSCTLKQLKGRWGSCDQQQHIILNSYLMQLPVHLIDYVIYHELAHTRAMNHGDDFWRELLAHLPNAKLLRKQLRQYQPSIPATRQVEPA